MAYRRRRRTFKVYGGAGRKKIWVRGGVYLAEDIDHGSSNLLDQNPTNPAQILPSPQSVWSGSTDLLGATLLRARLSVEFHVVQTLASPKIGQFNVIHGLIVPGLDDAGNMVQYRPDNQSWEDWFMWETVQMPSSWSDSSLATRFVIHKDVDVRSRRRLEDPGDTVQYSWAFTPDNTTPTPSKPTLEDGSLVYSLLFALA